jgi:hypothetical protein
LLIICIEEELLEGEGDASNEGGIKSGGEDELISESLKMKSGDLVLLLLFL